jgi:aminopeptidase YwaD
MMIEPVMAILRERFSGVRAAEHVAELVQHHRIQASPGFRAAAHYCLEQLKGAGIDAELLSFRASEEVSYWSLPLFSEWKARAAALDLISPAEAARSLADFSRNKISLIQHSAPAGAEADIVVLEDGEKEEDYQDLDVSGKVVVTKGDLDIVRHLAVEERGAIGIIFDGMRETPPVRGRFDLPNARQYTSFWWQAGVKKCFGFVIPPAVGVWLRDLTRGRRERGETPPRVSAHVDTDFVDGEMEVVSALLPGERQDEIVIIAHLCHPQPSANDNASGAAVALEGALTLGWLIREGVLPKPQRSIRLLLVPEIRGTCAYFATDPERASRMLVGLNLDMVGQDQSKCGSSFIIERPPDASASYAPDLLEFIRERLDRAPAFSGEPELPLYREASTRFSGGSDHAILSDPLVGVPTPMIIQWPDRFYHTDQDTIDKVDPEALRRVGVLSGTYAYFLAQAGEEEVRWMALEYVARHKRRLLEFLQESLSRAFTSGEASASLISFLERKVDYLSDRGQAALETLRRLEEVEIDGYAEEMREFAVAERRKARYVLAGLAPQEREDEERAPALPEERDWILERKTPGPVSVTRDFGRLSPEERRIWLKLSRDYKGKTMTLRSLLLFWADGRRRLSEIVELIEMETGWRAAEFIGTYAELLGGLGQVDLRRPEAEESGGE